MFKFFQRWQVPISLGQYFNTYKIKNTDHLQKTLQEHNQTF